MITVLLLMLAGIVVGFNREFDSQYEQKCMRYKFVNLKIIKQ